MRKTDFRFALFLKNIKNNVRASPLILFPKAKAAVQHVPNDSFARNEFLDLLFGTVHIFVTIGELCAKFVRVALDLS